MSEKKNDDYDGPTINGRPILGVEDVQKWFASEGCIISAECAAAIARDLNYCALVSFLWKSTPALRSARRNSAFHLSSKRIHFALKSLQHELPILINNTRKVFPNTPPSLVTIEALLAATNNVAPGFQKFAPRGRGRETDLWHNIARNVGQNITKAFAKYSGRRAGLGKSTSPAIKILKSALAYLDENHSEEAIVDAVRSRRSRTRSLKKLGK